jgi:hypothetical protein
MLGKNTLMSKLESYQRKNKRFEELKGMDADTFDQLFNNGDLGDDKEWIEWDHVISVIRVLKSKLSELDDVTYSSFA